jgi:hypothetical protein
MCKPQILSNTLASLLERICYITAVTASTVVAGGIVLQILSTETPRKVEVVSRNRLASVQFCNELKYIIVIIYQTKNVRSTIIDFY